MYREYQKGQYTISTDPARLDFEKLHALLSTAYWCEGIPKELVMKSAQNSLCFGIYAGQEQIGIARIVSDYTTFAYLCDVFIQEEYRGQGLGTWLMQCIMEYPNLQGLRRWSLVTRDAHELYRKFGFMEVKNPDKHMEITRPGMYQQAKQE